MEAESRMLEPGGSGRFRQRALLVIGISLYAFFFWKLYLNWLNPIWGYFGFTYREVPPEYLCASWVLALLPCLWMPLVLERPSQLIYWMFYLVVYVPSMFMPFFMHYRPDPDILLLIFTMAGGFWLMGLSYRFKRYDFQPWRIPGRLFWVSFAAITALFALWIMIAFKGQMKLVSAEDIYTQRAAAQNVTTGGLVGYPMLLMSGMIDPVLIAIGLVYKRRSFFLLGALGQILIYACAANKSVISSILFMPFLYYMIKRNPRRFGLMMVGIFAALSLLLFALNPTVASAKHSNGLGYTLTSLVLMRTIGTPGLLISQYHCFFANHPLTYMSHMNGVNLFVTYPYPAPLGYMIGNYFMGFTDMQANGNVWATDGIAGLWLPGILIISVVCAVVFWLLDSFAARQDILLTSLAVTFSALNICNISIFTCLISGGLLPLMLFLYLMPKEMPGPLRLGPG